MSLTRSCVGKRAGARVATSGKIRYGVVTNVDPVYTEVTACVFKVYTNETSSGCGPWREVGSLEKYIDPCEKVTRTLH